MNQSVSIVDFLLSGPFVFIIKDGLAVELHNATEVMEVISCYKNSKYQIDANSEQLARVLNDSLEKVV